ncbi:DUF3526 domain-containing protein [Marixanthomonas sp. SCSIO 43207]|uniref:DUF3526 domain-containing protein n=1 Tax=Marixanthomonas sp. SCSIO 43207 TaxID=2779360 RepID=UPI001CAA261D|nr:DUF3526 domain-containing protein [Marixanthomonas sp. SCSIO 43207]UAB80014.1 DUF3526 domain-containing protein [Marixanthomonas sp. SCSIO 43207]
MFKYNFIYEIKQLLRSRWLQVFSVLLLILFGFAIYNGVQRQEKRQADLTAAKAEMNREYTSLYNKLDSLEQGYEVSPSWVNRPLPVGNFYPRVAAIPSGSLTFSATGQSDIFSNFKQPTFTYGDLIEEFTEMTSPVQLLFGSFDLAFVIVYLLPLLIIAFSYNVLSAERENGTLRLLGSQSISLRGWLFQKLLIRFFWLAILVLVSITLVLLFLASSAFSDIGILLSLYGLILGYMLFWFALAFLINLWVGTSAKNAVSLLGFWIFFVLLVPSILNQLGTTLYPMPSRTLLINEVRALQADVTKRQDEILDNYLRDHPELALNDSTQTRTFYHKYVASQKVLRDELQPTVNKYNAQLQKQQEWVGRFKWLSPAVITQESLNQMAGTATQDYENFRRQVADFSKEWRNHFMPFVYNNDEFTKADIENLPNFNYEPLPRTSIAPLIIFLIAFGVFAIGFLVTKKRESHLITS